MDSAVATPRKAAAVGPWLTLLAVSLLINYVDRGNLSLAAPLLKDELGLTAWHLGVLLSAFFWTYMVLQFVMGPLVDRLEAGLVLAVGYVVWSLATAATGLAQGFAMLLLMRLVLGIGESVVFPACSKILARHIPEASRGFANGVLMAGMKAGPAAGTFGAGMLMAKYGWRPVFIAVGLLSLLWLPAWRKWKPTGPGLTRHDVAGGPTWMKILSQRSFWGACGGHFSANYLLYFMVTWLPFYLVHERHLSLESMSKTAGAYYIIDAAAAIATGWVSDFFIRHGHSTTVVRKSAMALGHTTAAIALAGCAMAGPHTYLIWLLAAGIGSGITGSGIYAFCQTLAGPKAAGRWTGFQNGFANFAGIIAPALTGFTVNRTGNFLMALAVTSVVTLAGALAWVFVIGRLEPVNWPTATEKSFEVDLV
jgi:MFS family permease